MDLQVPEAAREHDMLVRRERLVPEEDDLVVVQRLAQLGHHLVREGGSEVDSGDLRPHGRTELACIEVLPLQCRQAIPLGRHVRERPDRDGVARKAEGAGLLGARRRRHRPYCTEPPFHTAPGALPGRSYTD